MIRSIVPVRYRFGNYSPRSAPSLSFRVRCTVVIVTERFRSFLSFPIAVFRSVIVYLIIVTLFRQWMSIVTKSFG